MSGRIWVALVAAMTAGLAAAQGVIKHIDVAGNRQVSREAILLRLQTKVGDAYTPATLAKDKDAIGSMGFFERVDFEVGPTSDSNWDLTVKVKEWPVVKEIRVVGNKAVKTPDILKVIDVQPGKIFNSNDVGPSAKKIGELYAKRGFYGPVEAFGPTQDSPQTVTISIVELTVETVGVEGNVKTKPWVFGKLLKTKPGEPFDREKWYRDLARIDATRLFKDVQGGGGQPEPGLINLVAKVKEAPTRNAGIGAQLDPRSSFGGFLRLSDTNLYGTGQMVRMDLSHGTTNSSGGIDLGYGNPFLNKTDTALQVSLYTHPVYHFAGSAFGGGGSVTSDSRYSERRVGGEVSIAKPINEHVTAAVSTRVEDVSTNDLNPATQTGFVQQDGKLASLLLSLTRSTRDVEDDPSRGDWLRFEFQPGYSDIRKLGGDAIDPSILGPNAYLKTGIEYRKYLSDQGPRDVTDLAAPRRVLAFRMRYGAIIGNVPFFEQYFAGGADSIRGYSEDQFWGKQQFLTSLEYRRPVQKGMNVIGFIDYGGAWGGYGSVGSFMQSGKPNFSLGYGIGLSFRIPKVGPLRFDYGFDRYGHGRAHFLIGTSF